MPRPSRDADTLNRMMPSDQIPGHPEVLALLPYRTSLLGRLDRHRCVRDPVPVLDLHLLDIVRVEDVRHEFLRFLREVDDLDIPLQEKPHACDGLPFPPYRPARLALADDENYLLPGVDAV